MGGLSSACIRLGSEEVSRILLRPAGGGLRVRDYWTDGQEGRAAPVARRVGPSDVRLYGGARSGLGRPGGLRHGGGAARCAASVYSVSATATTGAAWQGRWNR